MSDIQLRKFYCTKHPNELIQRVFTGDVTSPLLCVECLLLRETTTEKANIKTLKAFIDEIASSTENDTDFEINRQNYPPELEEILKAEDETVKRLAEHIEKEKQKVDEVYEQVKEKVLMVLQKKRVELLSLLDGQLHTFKQNYRRFKNKINKFFHGESEDGFKTKGELIDKINSFKESYELESLVSTLLEEYLENKAILAQGKDYVEALKENIATVAKDLKSQSNHFPTSVLTNPLEFEKVATSLQEEISKDLIKVNRIENPLIDIMISGGVFDTEILKNNRKLINQLKQWIIPEKTVKFKLLWRCSKDGWDWSKFYSKCGTAKPNLILAKIKQNGQIIGGYTDQDWQPTSGYKTSKFSFLFNLTTGKKHKLKKNLQSNAVYCLSGNGPTFGSGYDLYFAPNMNTTTSSYSYIGYTYDGTPDTSICGVTNFSVEEFEFYECEHRKLTSEDETWFYSEDNAQLDASLSEGSVVDEPPVDQVPVDEYYDEEYVD